MTGVTEGTAQKEKHKSIVHEEEEEKSHVLRRKLGENRKSY